MRLGVDIVENQRFKNRLDEIFLKHFLSDGELTQYKCITDEQAKINYVSGRWAAKEAVYKALNPTHKLSLRKIEIGYDSQGAPVILNPRLNHIQVSISHENNYSVAIALNEIGERG